METASQRTLVQISIACIVSGANDMRDVRVCIITFRWYFGFVTTPRQSSIDIISGMLWVRRHHAITRASTVRTDTRYCLVLGISNLENEDSITALFGSDLTTVCLYVESCFFTSRSPSINTFRDLVHAAPMPARPVVSRLGPTSLASFGLKLTKSVFWVWAHPEN